MKTLLLIFLIGFSPFFFAKAERCANVFDSFIYPFRSTKIISEQPTQPAAFEYRYDANHHLMTQYVVEAGGWRELTSAQQLRLTSFYDNFFKVDTRQTHLHLELFSVQRIYDLGERPYIGDFGFAPDQVARVLADKPIDEIVELTIETRDFLIEALVPLGEVVSAPDYYSGDAPTYPIHHINKTIEYYQRNPDGFQEKMKMALRSNLARTHSMILLSTEVPIDMYPQLVFGDKHPELQSILSEVNILRAD